MINTLIIEDDSTIRELINYNSTKELNKLVSNININNVNVGFIFKNLYLYSCKNGTMDVIIWFIELYMGHIGGI